MAKTRDPFPLSGAEMNGIPCLVCPACGEIAFTPSQLDMVFGYGVAQRQLGSATPAS